MATVYTTGIRLREATNLTWADVDFEAGQLHVSRKDAHEFVQPWQPKDYELRTIPLPRQAVDLLATLQAEAPEGCPYVYMERPRWEYYRKTVQAGRWQPGRDLSNNLLRRFQTLCRQAGVGTYTLHDLRRSCITNWALHLPIHVVQQLAGHSDIKTTQQFYLSIRQEDVSKAQKVQEEILGQIPTVQPPGPDHKSRRRPPVFPGRQGCRPRSSPLD